MLLFSCNENENNAEKDKESYESAKETLQQKELKSPQNFITVSGHNRNNLVGQTVV